MTIDLEEARKRLTHKVITFGGLAMKAETYAGDMEPGQKARVLSVEDDSVDDTPEGIVYRVKIDFSEFEEHNKALAKPDYYDKDRRPVLKRHETLMYPPDCRDSELVGGNPEEWPFESIDDDGRSVGPVVLSAEDWRKITEALGCRIAEMGIRPV